MAIFATGVVDTSSKSTSGVVDTGGEFAAGVVDTGGKFATGAAGLGGRWFIKKILKQKISGHCPFNTL